MNSYPPFPQQQPGMQNGAGGAINPAMLAFQRNSGSSGMSGINPAMLQNGQTQGGSINPNQLLARQQGMMGGMGGMGGSGMGMNMGMGMNNFGGGMGMNNGANGGASASTINPAMLGASGSGTINPAMMMQQNTSTSSNAQLTNMSSQEMQFMQERAMQQRQAAMRMGMMGTPQQYQQTNGVQQSGLNTYPSSFYNNSNVNQMPPPRPSTAMSSSSQTSHAMVSPTSTMAHPSNANQQGGMSISRPGTASGSHHAHSPVLTQHSPVNAHPQLQRELSRPPSRPQTSNSNHPSNAAPQTPPQTQMQQGTGHVSPTASRGMTPSQPVMQRTPSAMGMGNMSVMGNMNMAGMSGGMNNMGMNMGGMGMGGMNPNAMRSQAQMGQMSISGASYMGGAGGGMMPPPTVPRQASQGNLHANSQGQLPGNQYQGQMQARISTPVSSMSPQAQMSHSQSIPHHSPPPQQPGFPPTTPTNHAMSISLNGNDTDSVNLKPAVSPGVMGGIPGVPGANAMNMGMGTSEMQLRQMQVMQERKAMALAAMQQQPSLMGSGTSGALPAAMQAQRLQQQLSMQTPPRPGTAGNVPSTPATSMSSGMPALAASAMPTTPARTGGATPAIHVAGGTGAAPTVNGAVSTNQYSLPPLPASVQLNPSVTKVTPVPLAQSGTLIPTLAIEEIENIKKWTAADRAYEARFLAMKERAKQELVRIGVPAGAIVARPKWWERDPETEAMVAERRQKGKFALEYPYGHASKEGNSKRRAKRREGLKIPGRLKPTDANRTEQLVPIRLEFDVEHYKYRDTFVWNLNDPIVTPEVFAQSVVDDYGLPSSYHSVITKTIQEQLSDYKAHSALLAELETGVVSVESSGADGPLLKGQLEDDELQWWESWRKRLRNKDGYVRTRSLLRSLPDPPSSRLRKRRKAIDETPRVLDKDGPMDVEMFEFDEDKMHEEMRILIKLDITVGSMKLDDQFEWDIENPDSTPEQFAEIYGNDLGLAGEFKTAIAHSIREQVSIYQKSLFLVGHPSDGSAVQDDDLRMSFLSQVTSVARSVDTSQNHQPIINYLSDGELDRIDKEREKELNRRRKRNTRGRRGILLPDREPLKTHRTPAIGFPEIDPSTLALAAAAAAPTSRRAAAAVASVNIANMVASENGTAVITPSAPVIQATPSLPQSKIPKAKGSFKAPSYPSSILKPRADVVTFTPSTAADISTFEPPLEEDPPLPPVPVTISAPDSRSNKVVSAKRLRELEKEAKEKEFADGQRANMINGIWHCSNCGCPDSVAIGRRKGPLGDKSQCGACGKFWHRHRRPRPVDYNTDAEYHINLKLEAEKVKASAKKRGGAAALRALNIQQDMPATPASTNDDNDPPYSASKSDVWADVKTPRKSRGNSEALDMLDRPLSPASSVSSSASERPLAQTVLQVNGSAHKPSSSTSTAKLASEPPPQSEPAMAVDRDTTRSEPPQSQVNVATVSTPAIEPVRVQGTPPPKPPRPQWLETAMAEMQAKYPDDKFEVLLRRPNGTTPEWRVRCLDCPGKLYTPGPGESLNNYEVHLKNRQHRGKVQARLSGSTQ